jgi:hypothetical protein
VVHVGFQKKVGFAMGVILALIIAECRLPSADLLIDD